MTRLYIVRHGETLWNALGRIQGHLDVELSQKGLEQASFVAERLRHERIDVVYASDRSRAYVTGEIIARPHGAKVVQTALLREAMLGEWQGLTLKEVGERYPEQYAAYRADSVGHRPPGAERLEEVISRCREFLDLAVMKHPNGSVAVAAHGGSVRGLLAAAFGIGPEIYRRVRMDNAGLTVLEIRGGKPLLVTLNDTCHIAVQPIVEGADQ